MTAETLANASDALRVFRAKLALLLGIIGILWVLKLWVSPSTLAAEISIAMSLSIAPTAWIALQNQPPSHSWMLASLAVDVIVLTVAIHLGGGADQTSGPILYSVLILLGGLLVSERAAVLLTMLAILSYTGMVVGEYWEWLPHHVAYRRPPDRQMATALMVSVYLAVVCALLSFLLSLVRRRLRQAHALRVEALAALSHDLKNPLNAIYGYADFIAAEADSSSKTHAHRIRFLARKSSDLIADVLDTAAGEARPLVVRAEKVVPAELLRLLMDWFADAAASQGIVLELDTTAPPPDCLADSHLLERALANLLHNALRHTPRGGRVVLGCEQRGDQVVWSVTDNGEGVPSSLLPHLFDAFLSGAAPSEQQNRSGLGLYIVRRIARAHGGEVTVHSQPGQGSRFEVSIPLKRADPSSAHHK